jgi:hypothetical protein
MYQGLAAVFAKKSTDSLPVSGTKEFQKQLKNS